MEPKPCCALSGISEYELRKYVPALGRWANKDPLGEYAFFTRYTHEMAWEERIELSEKGRKPSYVIGDNRMTDSYDPLGLWNVDESCGSNAQNIYNAFVDLCGSGSGLGNDKVKCCLNDIGGQNFGAMMNNICNDLSFKIRCASGAACKKNGGTLCGFNHGGGLVPETDPRHGLPPGIYLCPDGANGTAGCGGKTGCTLLHEMMHSKGAVEPQSRDAEKCIGCS